MWICRYVVSLIWTVYMCRMRSPSQLNLAEAQSGYPPAPARLDNHDNLWYSPPTRPFPQPERPTSSILGHGCAVGVGDVDRLHMADQIAFAAEGG
jgi:hypothetical protein